MRKAALTLCAALVLAACSDPAPPVQPVAAEMAAVCVSTQTGLRADDDACDWDDDDSDDLLFFPYFYPSGYGVHAIGHKVSGGSRVKPHTAVKIYRAPAAGGSQRVYTVPGGPKQQPAAVPAKPAQPPVIAPAKPAVPPAPAKPFNPPPRPRR